MTIVSVSPDSTHWAEPAPATRLVDENGSQTDHSAGGTMTPRQRLSMIVVTVLAALGLSFAGAGVASAAPSAPTAAPPVTALTTPITGTADNGSFAGTFTPTRFSTRNGNLLATGVLTGTVSDTSGATIG